MRTQKAVFKGPAGAIEGLIDTPDSDRFPKPLGTAVIAHPHPQFGGTMTNKVVHTIARACVERGWRAARFNYRGVGGSAGSYDEGRGETADLLAVVKQAAPAPEPLVLAGFSFGAFVTVRALGELYPRRPISRVVLVGTAAEHLRDIPVPEPLRDMTLAIHGEQDDTVRLATVLDWARPQSLPITVVPGCEHFFHGQLALLKTLVMHHIGA
jgi:alpha/beta superfamily hydrolase